MQVDGHDDAVVQHARASGPANGSDDETTLQAAAAMVAETSAWHQVVDQGALLFEIVHTATRLIPGCSGAAILLGGRPGPARRWVLAGALASAYPWENVLDEGPTWDLTSAHPAIAIPDLARESRWPAFRAAASAAGIGSLLCQRLVVANRPLGVLLLTSGRVGVCVETDILVSIFVAQAVAALHTAETINHLHQALTGREVIGCAKGILMTRHKVSDREAFEILRRESQNYNVRLRRVSEMLCQDKRLPSEGRGR